MPHPNTHTGRPPQQGRGQQPAPEIPTADIRLGDGISHLLYADIAEAKARFLAENSRDVNKGTQLRRFYDELSLWNEKVNGSGTPEDRQARYREFAPLIKMLNAKVAYARGRKHVDENFEKLLRHLIGQVQDPATLAQAKLFMEAFMGFYKAYNPR
jgi:CRISPR-associated protein Csm2